MLDEAFVYTSRHTDWWILQESPQGYESDQEKDVPMEGEKEKLARLLRLPDDRS